MNVSIKSISYYLPEKCLRNDELQQIHPNWDVNKVAEKSGVEQRYIVTDGVTALDLAIGAIERLFKEQNGSKESIQGIIFCTQSPDYIMPSNAFLIHKYFNFNTNIWAFDYNLACSGFVYGISIARGMIATGMAKNVLLINADTYSKYINIDDRSTTVLFGDGAAASIIGLTDSPGILDIMLASSGKDFDSFYIPAGGCKLPKSEQTALLETDHSGNVRSLENIHMNGFAVWKFISKTVPDQINQLLERNNFTFNEIDLVVFHQASKLTLDSLIKSLKIDEAKVYSNLNRVGNTVSASIPIALKQAEEEGRLKIGDKVLISGFGVGLSWGSLIMKY